MRCATPRATSSISCASSSSTISSRPATRAIVSTVRSSWVGPSPPENTASRRASPPRPPASSSSGSSPTTSIREGARPIRVSSRARNAPLASALSPRTSSLPVRTTTARGIGLARRREGTDALRGGDDDDRRARGEVLEAAAVELRVQVPGRAELEPQPLVLDEALGLALLDRASKRSLPLTPPARTCIQQPPRTEWGRAARAWPGPARRVPAARRFGCARLGRRLPVVAGPIGVSSACRSPPHGGRRRRAPSRPRSRRARPPRSSTPRAGRDASEPPTGRPEPPPRS